MKSGKNYSNLKFVQTCRFGTDKYLNILICNEFVFNNIENF